MANRKVAEINRALRLADIPPRFEGDEARLLMRMWRRLADGHPVRPEQVVQIAGSIQMPLNAATAFVSRLSERDDAGNIVGIMGLSQKNHPHRFEVDGRVLSTWCAWDSLFLSPLLGREAKVESACPATKTKVRPEKIERREPALSLDALATRSIPVSGDDTCTVTIRLTDEKPLPSGSGHPRRTGGSYTRSGVAAFGAIRSAARC